MSDTVRSMTLRLPHELYVELCAAARAEGESVATTTRQAVRFYLNAKKISRETNGREAP